MGWGWNYAFMPYGAWWRDHRRAFNQYFNASKVINYKPKQLKASRKLLSHLLKMPNDFVAHVRLYVTISNV